MNTAKPYSLPRSYLPRRQVAMAFRKVTPPLLLTYFSQTPVLESGSTRSSSKRSDFSLGVGFLTSLARDSAAIPGSSLLGYGGASIEAVWQPQTEWLVRAGFGLLTRTFSPAQDPTGGQAQVGQYWTGNIRIEYEWLNQNAFRLSSGWSHLLQFGYRSRNYFTEPTYGQRFYYKTGISTMGRYEVSSGIDIYAEGQWLFTIGTPWESQGLAGLGVLFDL